MLRPPPFMDDFHPNVKVVHLPSSTTRTSNLWTREFYCRDFQDYLCHTFHQAVKATDESGTTLQQFWKDSNTYKSIKNTEFPWCEVMAITMNGAWNNLCPKLIHNFRGLEKVDEESKEVFSNWATLSKKLGLDLLGDNFTELLAGQRKDLLMKTWRNWRLRERTKRDKRKKK